MATGDEPVRTGRPCKTTAPRLRKIVVAFRRGSTTRQAALAGGISPSTLGEWLVRGRDLRHPGFREFTDRVDAALAELRAEYQARAEVARIEREARKKIEDEQWAAWRAEMDVKIAEHRAKLEAAAAGREGVAQAEAGA